MSKLPDTLKATVTPQRNQFAKLTGRYVARLGEWSTVGTTRDEAAFLLDEAIQRVQRHEHAERVLVANDGTAFVLTHSFGGWHYAIIRTSVPGAVSPSVSMMGEDYVAAYDSMKRHVAQWNEACAPVPTAEPATA